jgi:DNA-binding CsgD family transcriptional regulator
MLTATGAAVRRARHVRTGGRRGDRSQAYRRDARELTPREAQIARLAEDGRTSPGIGTRLFVGWRTAGWHLRTVFAKLGISSRNGLRQTLPDLVEVAVPA